MQKKIQLKKPEEKLPAWGNAVIENDVESVSRALKIPSDKKIIVANYEADNPESAEANAVLLAYIDLLRNIHNDVSRMTYYSTPFSVDDIIFEEACAMSMTFAQNNKTFSIQVHTMLSNDNIGFAYRCSNEYSGKPEDDSDKLLEKIKRHTEKADVDLLIFDFEKMTPESISPENLTMDNLDGFISYFKLHNKSLNFQPETTYILSKNGKYNAFTVYSYKADAYNELLKKLKDEQGKETSETSQLRKGLQLNLEKLLSDPANLDNNDTDGYDNFDFE